MLHMMYIEYIHIHISYEITYHYACPVSYELCDSALAHNAFPISYYQWHMIDIVGYSIPYISCIPTYILKHIINIVGYSVR